MAKFKKSQKKQNVKRKNRTRTKKTNGGWWGKKIHPRIISPIEEFNLKIHKSGKSFFFPRSRGTTANYVDHDGLLSNTYKIPAYKDAVEEKNAYEMILQIIKGEYSFPESVDDSNREVTELKYTIKACVTLYYNSIRDDGDNTTQIYDNWKETIYPFSALFALLYWKCKDTTFILYPNQNLYIDLKKEIIDTIFTLVNIEFNYDEKYFYHIMMPFIIKAPEIFKVITLTDKDNELIKDLKKEVESYEKETNQEKTRIFIGI
jgi:hypothetical protein